MARVTARPTPNVLKILCAAVLASTFTVSANGQVSAYPEDLLERIRQAADDVPGAPPQSINFIKFAESHRTFAAVIDGGSDEPFVSARTAFQVVYADGSLMIDAGMDEGVHRFYGFGRDEPYWPDRNDRVQAALSAANLIVVTHEHGDHVAGILRSPDRDSIAAKAILTQAQVRTLITAPQVPEIRMTEQRARDYRVVDYRQYLPVAPGVVLIEAPGHTPGHQMVYVLLADGAEFVFIGDIGWLIENVTELKLRPAETIARIGEDPEALMSQLVWLRGLADLGLILVPSHDDRLLNRYAAEGLLGNDLALPSGDN